MKIFFISFFLIGSIFLSAHNAFVYSRSAIDNLPFPGETCGVAEATDKTNICCSYKSIQPGFTSPNSVLDTVFNIVKSLTGGLIDSLFQMQQKVKIAPCISGEPSTPNDIESPDCRCVIPTTTPLTALQTLCNNLNVKEKQNCLDCITGNNPEKKVGVWTSIGCVQSDLRFFIQNMLLGWGIGLAGILALLCIIYSAFQLQTSRGNPESIKKAQELLTSCVLGLLLIIFSVFILRLIGIDILRIPGFGR